ncbi:MAG TPA: hypothetical protein VJ032_06220, partial [Thermoanaerobaculia bacterium]|nr:hypothetical protein [Thermoanaerobaculia bacterium]
LLNEPVADTYKAHADAGATFEQIVDVEKRAFGLRVIGDGQLSIAGKMVSAGRDHESSRTLAVYLREDRDGNRA